MCFNQSKVSSHFTDARFDSRAHSPNWDRFNVRKGYFKKDPTYPFTFSFDDYLGMPE
jgi:hypothetical protein